VSIEFDSFGSRCTTFVSRTTTSLVQASAYPCLTHLQSKGCVSQAKRDNINSVFGLYRIYRTQSIC